MIKTCLGYINIRMDIQLNKSYDLTEEHFEKFKEYFDYWIEIFGLKDWEIAYFFSKAEDEDDDGARASVHYDHGARIVVCSLNKEWYGSEPTNQNLARCAYHEVAELLLGKLNEYTRTKATDNEITGEIHRVIRILENVHFESVWHRILSRTEKVGE